MFCYFFSFLPFINTHATIKWRQSYMFSKKKIKDLCSTPCPTLKDIKTLQEEVSSWRLGEYWTLIQNGRTILTIRTFISYLKHYLFMPMLYLKLDYLNPITLHYKNLPPQGHLIPSYQSSSHSPTTSLEQCTLSFPNSQSFY